jgi:hypothetical protein
MPVNDLLTPWFFLAAVLLPLIYMEKWIHSHLYGVGWLLTNDKKSATALYYVFLLPGVFLHEFVQWLIAGAFNVKTKRVMAWPEAQNDGTLRLDFVQIKKANRFQAAIIGAAPLLTGLAVIWVISNYVLDFENVLSALGTGDITLIGSALQELASKTDFFLWLYLIFAIGNAMLPTPADRQGWPLLIGLFLAGLVALIVVGVGDVLVETLTGPVAHAVDLLTTAFTIMLLVEIPAILFIGFFEEVLERLTKRKFYYGQSAEVSKAREPGSNLPLPPGAPLPSIYNLELPIPDPAIHSTLAARASRQPARTPSEPVRSQAPDELQPPGPRPTARPGAAPTPADAPALARNPVLAQRQRTPPDRQIRRPSEPSEDERPVGPERRPGESERPARPAPFARPSGPPLRSPIDRMADDDDESVADEEPAASRPGPPRPGPFARPSGPPPRSPLPREADVQEDAGNNEADASPAPPERRPIPFPRRPESGLRSPVPVSETEDDEAEAPSDGEERRRVVPPPPRRPLDSSYSRRPVAPLRSPLRRDEVPDDEEPDDIPEDEDDDGELEYIDIDDI